MSSVETGQMSAVETGQMSAAETGQMSAVETRQMLKSQIRGRAQNHQNGPKWVENGRQVLRIGRHESHGSSGAFGTGLAHSIFFFRPPLGGFTPLPQPKTHDRRRRRVDP